MITLYYVQDISFEDEPYFADIDAQQDFFSSEDVFVKSIDTGFYPPHYRNSIRLGTGDIDVNDQVNYLSLDYEDKTYYYFIRAINYVSGGVIELEVEMDTIQTYMFNMDIHSALISRKFIDRWYDTDINRNYIKEQVSNGSMIVSSDTDVTDDFRVNSNDKGALIVLTTKPDIALQGDSTLGAMPQNVTTGSYSQITTVMDNGYTILPICEAPYGATPTEAEYESYLLFHFDGTNVDNIYNGKYVNTMQPLEKIMYNPNVQAIYYYPINLFDNAIYVDTGNIPTIKVANDFTTQYIRGSSVWQTGINNFGYLSSLRTGSSNYSPIEHTSSKQLNFVRNQSVSRKFESKYVPALLSNEYMQISFGDGVVSTNYDLYLLYEPSLRLCVYPSLRTGTMIYSIKPRSGYTFKTYDSVESSPVMYPLFEDSWLQWYFYNRHSLDGFALKEGSKVAETVASAMIGNGGIMGQVNNLNYYKDKLSRARSNSSINRWRRKITESGNKIGENIASSTLGSSDILTNIIDFNTTTSNAMSAPDTFKSTGNVESYLSSSSFALRYQIYKVSDFEWCAQYYHRYGYMVNEVWNYSDTKLFNYLNTRYYYFLVKLAHIDFSLNLLQSQDIMDNINDRFITGVRFWNLNSQTYKVLAGHIGNYYYDNVEV